MRNITLYVTFLGTAGSIPTPKRSLPAIAIQRKGELILFDCGEGTQRQMIQVRVGLHRKTKIFVTHMHGDHVLGLPGLFQTMSLLDRNKKLEIFGPSGIGVFIEAIKHSVKFSLTFPIQITELKNPGLVCEESEYQVYSVRADHGIESFAYALIEKPRPGKFHPDKALSLGVPEGPLWAKLQRGFKVKISEKRVIKPEEVVDPSRPGRKIVYSGDTRPTNEVLELSRNADILIHEATFDDELKDRAIKDGHSTPSQAAEIAGLANVKHLILTHVSARYEDSKLLLEQAMKVFPNVSVAEDLMRFDVPLLIS